MKNIENEYKKRFEGQELNSEFDVEGLWQDIIGDLDNPPTPPLPPSGGGNLGGFLKYGLLLIALIGVGLWYVLPTNQSTETATVQSSSASAKKTQATDIQADTEAKNSQNSTANIASENISAKTEQINVPTDKVQQESLAQNKSLTNQTANNKATVLNDVHTDNNFSISEAKEIAQILDKEKLTKTHIIEKQLIGSNSKKEKVELTNQDKKTIRRDSPKQALTNDTDNSKNKKAIATNSNPNNQKIVEAKTTTITNNSAPNSNGVSNALNDSLAVDVKSVAATTATKEKVIPNSANEEAATTITAAEAATKPNSATEDVTDIVKQPNKVVNDVTEETSEPSTKVPDEKETVSAEEEKGQQEEKRIDLPKLHNLSWEVGLHGGPSKMNLNFQSTKDTDLAALRNKYESGDWGYAIGMDVRMIWKNKWSINTGVSYQSLWSKLDYSKTWTQDSVLQIVEIDTSGNILETTYGQEKKTFNSLWHNQYTTYRIPLTIGYQQASDRWLYGANLGVIFNITTLQKGRTFDNESKISFFKQDDAHAPLNSFQVGFTVSPFIGYALSDKWTLRLAPSWNSYKGNTGRVSDFNFNIGLGMKF